MSIKFTCPHCEKPLSASDKMEGSTTLCPNCSEGVFVPSASSEITEAFQHTRSTLPPPASKEYKVLTQKDKWFSGKFDPDSLERALNAYAEQGWSVCTSVTASIPGFTGTREEIIIILER